MHRLRARRPRFEELQLGPLTQPDKGPCVGCLAEHIFRIAGTTGVKVRAIEEAIGRHIGHGELVRLMCLIESNVTLADNLRAYDALIRACAEVGIELYDDDEAAPVEAQVEMVCTD